MVSKRKMFSKMRENVEVFYQQLSNRKSNNFARVLNVVKKTSTVVLIIIIVLYKTKFSSICYHYNTNAWHPIDVR
jgi:N-glycosylase/DNA lyase